MAESGCRPMARRSWLPWQQCLATPSLTGSGRLDRSRSTASWPAEWLVVHRCTARVGTRWSSRSIAGFATFPDIYPRRRYPYVLLLLDVPLDAVDVNVHPAKEQVALLHAESVGRALERELRAELGRGFHEPLAGLALALTDADLPGLRAAERGEPYDAVGSWGTLTVEAGSLPRL